MHPMFLYVGNPFANMLGLVFAKYAEPLVQQLISNVHNKDVDRKIKLATIISLGDIALSLKSAFVPALDPVLQVLQMAGSTEISDIDLDNVDWVDYVNRLRESVLEAYISIMHGLNDGKEIGAFKNSVNAVLLLISRIVNDYKRQVVSNDVMKQACSALGDLVSFFQKELTAHLKNAPFVEDIVRFASSSSDTNVASSLNWLRTGLTKYGA